MTNTITINGYTLDMTNPDSPRVNNPEGAMSRIYAVIAADLIPTGEPYSFKWEYCSTRFTTINTTAATVEEAERLIQDIKAADEAVQEFTKHVK